MNEIKKLKEERGNVFASAQAIRNAAKAEKRSLTVEETAAFDAKLAQVESLTKEIDAEERMYDLERSISTRSLIGREDRKSQDNPEQVAEKRKKAFNAYLRHGDRMNPELRQWLGTANIAGDYYEGDEHRALSVSGIGAVGPRDFSSQIVDVLKDFGAVRRAGAQVMTTSNGNPFIIPTGDDTGNTGELVAEAGAVTADVNPTIGNKTLNGYKYSSKVIKVSVELLQDEAFNLEQYLIQKAGERIGRITNTHFTTGDDSAKPNGIVTAASAGVTLTDEGVITYGELVDLEHSIDPAYRQDKRRCKFMMDTTTLAAVRKIKDSQNRPILQEAANGAALSTIFGYEVIENGDMADFSATLSAKLIAFGDFSKYLIRDVTPITVRRLDELYALNGQVGFFVFSRHDGELTDTTAVKLLVNPAS